MLHHADCRDAMRAMEADSIDAIVTDPPYGLSFMGKGWDHGVPGVEFWREALRVTKPGGHLLAFGGTRTYHRLACAIEDAGWEVRDCLSWLYGSGFPKSLDVSKAIDKAAGAERKVVGYQRLTGTAAIGGDTGRASVAASGGSSVGAVKMSPLTAPATDAARQWQGWGTALKPAWEPIILARKPIGGTVAANVLTHGTGALNIDGCRIPMSVNDAARIKGMGGFGKAGYERPKTHETFMQGTPLAAQSTAHIDGRWPANVALDEAAAELLGEPSRFFYTAKASRSERGEANTHPTVKPIALMRWLVRLVCPPNGLVLDPFNGSGSTGVAALAEGMRYVGCEREAEYVEIARRRLESSHVQTELLR
jgi:site-specific DNA-methyltransferase (adenine-specific)